MREEISGGLVLIGVLIQLAGRAGLRPNSLSYWRLSEGDQWDTSEHFVKSGALPPARVPAAVPVG
jgi:hypothetical protein